MEKLPQNQFHYQGDNSFHQRKCSQRDTPAHKLAFSGNSILLEKPEGFSESNQAGDQGENHKGEFKAGNGIVSVVVVARAQKQPGRKHKPQNHTKCG